MRTRRTGLLEHPIVPLLIGALLTWDAPGNIRVRSFTLALCLLWIAWGIWKFLTNDRRYRRNRSILFCLLVGLSSIAMMRIMYWLLELKLEEQQTKHTANCRQRCTFLHRETYFSQWRQ